MRRLGLHAMRIAIFSCVLWLLHLQGLELSAQRRAAQGDSIPIAVLRAIVPEAATLRGEEVLSSEGSALAKAIQTSPQADDLIGFSGPTNVLLVLDASDRIMGLQILASGDTRDHVAKLREDPRFLAQYVGMSRAAARDRRVGELEVDSVSGATLTARAVAESIRRRLGSRELPASRFDGEVGIEDARRFFENAMDLDRPRRQMWVDELRLPEARKVLDANGDTLGLVLRTSPAGDREIGYQGPSDALVAFDAQERVVGTALRASFDNEPYVRYVREDAGFAAVFDGLGLDELAGLDLAAHGVEGVSGATMTSMALARAIVASARLEQQLRRAMKRFGLPAEGWTWPDWEPRAWGTIAVTLLGLTIAFTSLRRRRLLRLLFQVVLVAYVGWLNGDLVSLAFVAGWAQHGVAWQHAAGLAALTLAAFIVPLLARSNPYCAHLCPHGALQQWLARIPRRSRATYEVDGGPDPRSNDANSRDLSSQKQRSSIRPRVRARWQRYARAIPALLLAAALIAAMLPATPWTLVDLEAFDAWIPNVAGVAALSLAVLGLVASVFVPMAYCRFGCPTGGLLRWLTLGAERDRFSRNDLLAIGLLVCAIVLRAV